MNNNQNITNELTALQIQESEVLKVAAALEKYFLSIQLPQDIQLNKHTYLFDIGLFIKSHLTFVRANENKATYLPYLLRLVELEKLLIANGTKWKNIIPPP
jgi:hypothetical protein